MRPTANIDGILWSTPGACIWCAFHTAPVHRDENFSGGAGTLQPCERLFKLTEQLFRLSRGYAVDGDKVQILFYPLVMDPKAT